MSKRYVEHKTAARSREGEAHHGSRWDSGIVVNATSRGPGIPVLVQHPYRGIPRRVISGEGTVKHQGGHLSVTPTIAPAGERVSLVVEF